MVVDRFPTTEKTYYLHPGNLFAHREAHLVTTILGSCISLCLWDPVTKVGGVNHYMLPLWNGEGLPTPKYGNIAIGRLIERLEMLGANRKVLKAKIFGGSSIQETSSGLLNVGARNIMVAKDILEEKSIPLVNSDTGGSRGRRLLYFTGTGVAKIRYIKKSSVRY